jgi:TolB protein
MNPDGTHRRRLAPGGDPQWSPDGRRIAYDADDGIFVMNSDGTGNKRLTRSGGGPYWSPDGKQIAFTSGGKWTDDAYVVNADGSGERRLTRTGDSFVAAWAPGRKIIFTRTSVGIYIVNADGTGLRSVKLTSSTPYAVESGGWSPDAELIVYAQLSRRSALNGISTVRPRDGFVRRLTRGPRGSRNSDSDPTWGHDGRVIAFARSYTKHEDGIWIVNRDGSRERRIAVAPLVGPFRWNDYYTPTWAPR